MKNKDFVKRLIAATPKRRRVALGIVTGAEYKALTDIVEWVKERFGVELQKTVARYVDSAEWITDILAGVPTGPEVKGIEGFPAMIGDVEAPEMAIYK